MFDVCGRAGSLIREDAVSALPTLRPLSMTAVANDEDFFRKRLPLDRGSEELLSWGVSCDIVAGPVELSPVFFPALPRSSLAISAAGFFFDWSSSEERLEDMMVSSVPYAALFLRPPLLRFRWVRAAALSSSSELKACRVGPPML